jgi:predicted DNA-binding helix-hairpin-helix protein
VEINRAVYEQLIRIPGIGPKRARVILDARRKGKINTLEELAKLGVVTKRAAPFILFNGKAPMSQLRLFV